MAISFVGQTATGGTSTTLPTGIQTGDYIIAFAYRNATTAPSLATGYTNITTQSANSNSFRIAYKIATSTDTAGSSTGTWTNASDVVVMVYRGVTGIGASGSGTNAASTSATVYGITTMQSTNGLSWAVSFAGSKQTTSMSTPTGTTARASLSVASSTTMVIGVDSGAGVTAWAAHTTTLGTSATNASASVELLSVPVVTQTAGAVYVDGTESGTATIPSPLTMTSDQQVQVRFRLQETKGVAGSTSDTYTFLGSYNTTSLWNGINTSSSQLTAYDSASLTTGQATTNRLGAGTGSFIAGVVSETGSATGVAIPASGYTELLFPVTIDYTKMGAGDVLRFKLNRNGASLPTYSVYPTITVDEPITNLVDAFSGTTVNTTLWTQTNLGSVTTTADSTGVSLTYPASTTTAADGEVDSTYAYNLTGASASLHVISVASNGGATTTDNIFRLAIDTSNYVDWLWESGNLYAQKMVAGTSTNMFNMVYDPVAHAYWRIRESAGTTYWETSSDGMTYTTQWSVTNPIAVTALKVIIAATAWSTATSPGTYKFNNFNVTPTAPVAVQDGQFFLFMQ